jgi:hypothetical protein
MFAGKARAHPREAPAYYENPKITTVKSFIVQAPGLVQLCRSVSTHFMCPFHNPDRKIIVKSF